MNWWQVLAGVAALFVLWQVIAYFAGNPKFWRLAAQRPDLALNLFACERGCIVDAIPPADRRQDYTGPFRLLTRDGETHTIYILFEDVEAIQARLAAALTSAK